MKYLALLRGVNVGGKAMIKMADLKVALEKAGFGNTQTYIQSGNVIFESDEKDKDKLAKSVSSLIEKKFGIKAGVAVFSQAEWQAIINAAPKWWGVDKAWRHNLLIMIRPFTTEQVIEAVGELKPGIEAIVPGEGVLYQSYLFEKFGQTTSSKLLSSPVYKQLTIRNYNTATKLGILVETTV